VKFIWKDYPEANLEADSFQASVAARCAQKQGAFWNYHDLLFDREEALNENNFYQIAQDLDLDMDIFRDCFKNQKTRNLIIDNMTEAEALGIDGIPFMYVNDQQLVGELNYDDLKKVIDIQLEKSEKNGE
jgi:protein-disulfide isomerase